MKVIFLDVDGVLNNYYTLRRISDHFNETKELLVELEEVMVERLSRIVKATDASIVLSSAWRVGWSRKGDHNRYCEELEMMLEKYGVEIIDKTEHLQKRRGDEIFEWLSRHDEVENYIIIDDCEIALADNTEFDQGKILYTTYEEGLLEEHVEKAIKMLNKNV